MTAFSRVKENYGNSYCRQWWTENRDYSCQNRKETDKRNQNQDISIKMQMGRQKMTHQSQKPQCLLLRIQSDQQSINQSIDQSINLTTNESNKAGLLYIRIDHALCITLLLPLFFFWPFPLVIFWPIKMYSTKESSNLLSHRKSQG